MSNSIDIVVNFKDNTTWIFERIQGFEHIAEHGVWQIVTIDGDLNYISDSEVRFIGHKYVWDGIVGDTFEKSEEEDVNEDKPIIDCDACRRRRHCASYNLYEHVGRSKPDATRCDYYDPG